MSFITVTNTFVNTTTADAAQVNTNFTDIINGLSDGTKDISIAKATIGSDLTVTGSLAATLPIKTNTSFNFGDATHGLQYLYLGGSSTYTGRIGATTLTSSKTYTLPDKTGTIAIDDPVEVRAHSSNTVINSTGNVDLIFGTETKDTHNAYNNTTGVFTAPRAGRVQINCVFRSSSGVSAGAVGDAAYLLVTNVTQSKSYWINYLNAFTTSSIFRFLQGSIGIDVNAADQIKIQGSRDAGHGDITGANSEVYTWVDFKMV